MPVHKGEITEHMTNIVALFNLIRHKTIRDQVGSVAKGAHLGLGLAPSGLG